MLEILRYPIPWDSFPLFGYLCLQHLLLLIIVQLSIIDQGHWSTHLPTPGPIHPIDANFYRFQQLIQYPLCLHPNPPMHLPNQFFIVSPFCLFLRSCLEAACTRLVRAAKLANMGIMRLLEPILKDNTLSQKGKLCLLYMRLQKY